MPRAGLAWTRDQGASLSYGRLSQLWLRPWRGCCGDTLVLVAEAWGGTLPAHALLPVCMCIVVTSNAAASPWEDVTKLCNDVTKAL